MNDYIEQTLKKINGKLISGKNITKNGSHLLITGLAGSGKTTLCNHLYKELIATYNQDIDQFFPIFIKAKALNNVDLSNLSEIALIQASSNEQDNEKHISSYNLPSKKKYFIIDGLDEISHANFSKISKCLSNTLLSNNQCKSILTSRPYLNLSDFDGFEKYELQLFNLNDINKYVKSQLGDNVAKQFISAINTATLNDLLSNPLLLTLSLKVFKYYGTIPNNIYHIVESNIEQLLSSWDSVKDIGPRSLYSLEVNLTILSFLSHYLEVNDKQTFAIEEFGKIYNTENVYFTIDYYIQRGILIKKSNESYSFPHVIFKEYFLAKYYIGSKSSYGCLEKVNLLKFNSRVFDFLIQEKQIHAIRNYVVDSDIENKSIIKKLINLCEQNQSSPPSIESFLLDEKATDTLNLHWLRILKQNDLQKKGKEFEDFISTFLSSQFNILHRNILTYNGEFDLLIENKSVDPFWSEFRTDYLVECKYWSKNVPLKEILAFSQKIVNSRVNLGLFISISGFTKDAIRAFENIASNSTAPIVIPISGNELSNYLSLKTRDLNEFLKNQVRRIKYKKKY